MYEPKVSLIVIAPGAKMFSKQLCFKNSDCTEPIEGMTETFSAVVTNSQGNSTTEKLHIRKCKPILQKLNLSKQAYNHMTDGNNCPEWFKIAGKNPTIVWQQISKTQRLEQHLMCIAHDFGGTLKSYNVFEE